MWYLEGCACIVVGIIFGLCYSGVSEKKSGFIFLLLAVAFAVGGAYLWFQGIAHPTVS